MLTRLIANLLFGTAPVDPLTFAAVPFVLAAVALLASYIPARRATLGGPVVALRGGCVRTNADATVVDKPARLDSCRRRCSVRLCAHQGKRLNRCSRADHVSYAQTWCALSRWSSELPYDDWASSNCASSSPSRTAHCCAYGPKKLTTSTPSSRTRQPSSSPMMTKTPCFIRSPRYGKHQAHDSLPRATSAYERDERSDSIGCLTSLLSVNGTCATVKPSHPPGQGESICPTGHACESSSVTPSPSQGSKCQRKTT